MQNPMKQLYKGYRIVGMLMIIFAVTLYSIYFYIWLKAPETHPLGENMVKYEITIVPRIFTIKPITLIIVVMIFGYILVLESIRNPLAKTSVEKLYTIEAIALIILFISVYELIFNFMYWNSLITTEFLVKGSTVNIDLLSSKFPYSKFSWNLVFATKFFFMISSISILTIFFTNRWLKKDDALKTTQV